MEPVERFWEKVERTETCWNWTGAKRGFGHGVFWLNRRNIVASRFSYELAHGPVLDEQFVLHHCDNPACVNPEHLFLGDQADNQRDMAEKGRAAKGSRHGMAKLTEQDVLSMRSRSTGRRGEATKFAEEYGVSIANICYVLRRETWTHV